MDKIIKTIAPIACPHCSKEVMVSFRTMAPAIDWALKAESIKTLKEGLIAKVADMEFDKEEDKKGVLEWLADDNTAIGPEEVTLIIDQIKRDYIKG